jgi:hypothetical protein
MALQQPHNSVNDWVADSGTSHHTTHSVGNISNPRHLNSASPSSIVVGNGSTASSHTSPCAMSTIATPRILAVVATSTWHCRLGHPSPDALSSLSRSSLIHCTSTTHDFCHACQLGKHTRLTFSVHRVVWKKPLFYYILIFGHLPLLVCLVRNTTWSFLMILLIIYAFFC